MSKYQYEGQQTTAELADGRKVLLFKGSLLVVNTLSKQLQALFDRGLLKLLAS